jgi:hypothetical protein
MVRETLLSFIVVDLPLILRTMLLTTQVLYDIKASTVREFPRELPLCNFALGILRVSQP